MELDRRQLMIGATAAGLTLTVAPVALSAGKAIGPPGLTRFAVLRDIDLWGRDVSGGVDGAKQELLRSVEAGDVLWLDESNTDFSEPGCLDGYISVLKKPSKVPGSGDPGWCEPMITENPPNWWLMQYGDRWV